MGFATRECAIARALPVVGGAGFCPTGGEGEEVRSCRLRSGFRGREARVTGGEPTPGLPRHRYIAALSAVVRYSTALATTGAHTRAACGRCLSISSLQRLTMSRISCVDCSHGPPLQFQQTPADPVKTLADRFRASLSRGFYECNNAPEHNQLRCAGWMLHERQHRVWMRGTGLPWRQVSLSHTGDTDAAHRGGKTAGSCWNVLIVH